MRVDNDIDPEVQAVIVEEEGRILKDRVSYELITIQTSSYYVSRAQTMVGAVWGEVESLLVMVTVSTPIEKLNVHITDKWPLEKQVKLSLEDDRVYRNMATLACTMTSWVYPNDHTVLGITVKVTTCKVMAMKFPCRKI